MLFDLIILLFKLKKQAILFFFNFLKIYLVNGYWSYDEKNYVNDLKNQTKFTIMEIFTLNSSIRFKIGKEKHGEMPGSGSPGW